MERRPREARRQRIRRDEGPSTATQTKRKRSTRKSSQMYEDGAVTTAQPRVTDLIPLRKRSVLAWMTLLVLVVAMVEGLYWLRITRLDAFYSHTTPMHLFGPGTVANWVSSTLLIFSGLIAMLIYNVRKLRVDDYRGRYRVWPWISCCCFMTSLDAATGVHRLIQVTMIHVSDTRLWGDGSAWWLIVGGLVVGLMLFCGMRDAWRSRGAVMGLLMATSCYVGATILYLRLFSLGSVPYDMMVWAALLLSGHSMLLVSLLVYARFVCLQAGAASKLKTKARSSSSSTSSRRWWGRRDDTKKGSRKGKKSNNAAGKKRDTSDEGASESDRDMDQLEELSTTAKANPRKVRKRARKEQRRAA